MVDPVQITVFDRTRAGQEEFMLFTICVAAKDAKQQARKLEEFLRLLPPGDTPFERIRRAGDVRSALEQVRMGQYTRIAKAFQALASSGVDLETVTTEELERTPGVGLKTSRFFVLHSRPGARVACLDTHILRYMREELGVPAPKSTPTSPARYHELERKFLDHCDAIGREPSDLDLDIWVRYSSARRARKAA
jgi:hypothetical protein